MTDIIIYFLIIVIVIILMVFWKKINDLESLARVTSAWIANEMIEKIGKTEDQPDTEETNDAET